MACDDGFIIESTSSASDTELWCAYKAIALQVSRPVRCPNCEMINEINLYLICPEPPYTSVQSENK
jgi:hypothetical protein